MRQSQIDAREVFINAVALIEDKLRTMPGKANVTVSSARCLQGFLRIEIPMVTGQTIFPVPVVVQSQTTSVRPTENKLALQDMFCTAELSITTMLAASATATNNKQYTYEAPLVYTTSNASASILQLYAGFLSLTVDGITICPYWDIQRHYKVQRTQQGANLYYTSSAISTLDSEDFSDDSYVPVEPNWVMNGGGNIKMQINLPAALTAIQASVSTYFVVQMRGILLQNASDIQ